MGRIRSLLTIGKGSRGLAGVLLSPLTMLVVAVAIVLSLVVMLLSEHNFTNNAESATSTQSATNTQSVTNDQGAGPSYTIKDLGTLGGEDASNPTCTPPPTSTASASASAAPCRAGGESLAYGINDSGQVVGTSTDSGQDQDYNYYAFIYDSANGGMRQIPGTNGSYAKDINNSGQVTGRYYVEGHGGPAHAFLYDPTTNTTKDLGTLGGEISQPEDINASGQVVGGAYLPPEPDGYQTSHAFIYDDNSGMQDLFSDPQRKYSHAMAINDSGTVVGDSVCTNTSSNPQCPPNEHSFLYKEDGSIQVLPTLPGGSQISAWDVNNSGQVVGWSQTVFTTEEGETVCCAQHAFLYDEANGMQDLGTLPGRQSSEAVAINDSGDVVGMSSKPFLYKDGTMFDLNTLIPADSGWRIEQADDINNNGQIVGYGYLNGSQRAFLLTPKNTTSQPVDSASSEVAPGGDLSTATGDGTASSSDPVNTTITSPVGGTVSITETSTAQQAPSGFTFFGEQVNVEAPEATVGNPLILKFVLDASLLPEGQDPNTIEVFKNGTLVGECADASGTTASPDPCVSKREALAGGDVAISVLTSHASAWNFAAPSYEFGGFYSPVDNLPTLNKAKAGSAIPVRFSLGGDMGLNVFAKDQNGSYPKSGSIACDSGVNADTIEQTVNAGSSNLSYDASTGRYTYVWKTDKKWQNSCRQLVIQFKDGTEQHRANFQLTK